MTPEPLRRCSLCGFLVYRSDDCPRTYLHRPADYTIHEETP